MMSLKFWQRSSLSRKVATLVVLICILTLSLFSIAFLSQQYSLLRNQSKTALEALSRSVAFNIAAAVTFAAFSFLLSIEFYILQAPDVAIAEAAVGAGVSTAIFLIAIRATHDQEVT